MKKRYFVCSFCFFALFIYGLFIARYSIRIIPMEIIPKHPNHYYDYSGITHIHSEKSSGSGTLQEIVEQAQTSNLDFIYLTDLNNFDPILANEGLYGNLLVFVGAEYNYLDSKILNYHFSTNTHISSNGRIQATFPSLLSDSNRDKKFGLFVLSHPTKPNYNWDGEYPIGLDGIEVINLRSLWQKSWLYSKTSFLWTMILYPFNPRLAFIRLFTTPSKNLALWDQLSSRRQTIGFSGSDAESNVKISKNTSLEIPSYKNIFDVVRNHVLLEAELTGNATRDKEKVSSAIAKGQFYFSLDLLANPKGFEAFIFGKDGTRFPMGSEIKYTEDLELMVHLPHAPNVPFEVLIYKDGKKLITSNSMETKVSLHQPGVYRVVVRVIPNLPFPDQGKWIHWIYTNPFYLRN